MTQSPLFDIPAGLDQRVHPSGIPSVVYSYTPDPGGQSGVVGPRDFQKQAKAAVAEYYNQFILKDADGWIDPNDVFVVWFVKVIQNWKALCSTVIEDDRYFELTYNGDRRELYVDEYVKKGNQVFVQDTVPSQRDPLKCPGDGCRGCFHCESTTTSSDQPN